MSCCPIVATLVAGGEYCCEIPKTMSGKDLPARVIPGDALPICKADTFSFDAGCGVDVRPASCADLETAGGELEAEDLLAMLLDGNCMSDLDGFTPP
jgi:hypothetical protein